MMQTKNTDLLLIPASLACCDRKRIFQLGQALREVIIGHNPGGFTFDPFTMHPLPFDHYTGESYVISVNGYEKTFRGIPDFDALILWLISAYERLSHSGHYIGGWWWKGEFYLDVSTVLFGQERAFALARQNGQIAIYHPATNKSIWVPDVSQRAI